VTVAVAAGFVALVVAVKALTRASRQDLRDEPSWIS